MLWKLSSDLTALSWQVVECTLPLSMSNMKRPEQKPPPTTASGKQAFEKARSNLLAVRRIVRKARLNTRQSARNAEV